MKKIHLQNYTSLCFDLFLLCFFILFPKNACTVFAEEIVELRANSLQFRESFDAQVPVSGGAIVGICLGSVDGNVDIKNIMLPSFSGESVCVRVVTQDGRFSANNIYKKNGPMNSKEFVRLTPVSIKYANILSSYKMTSFAINAFISDDGVYVPEHTIHLPQIQPDSELVKTLTVLVNSGGRFSQMALENDGTGFLCQNVAEGARIAYDTVCTGNILRHVPGVKKVSITMDDGFESEEINFLLLLP